MLKGTALKRIVMSLLETGQHPMTVFTMSLWTRNPTPCSCLSSFSLKKTSCPSSVVVSPKFFHLIWQSPRMSHLYLSISCVSSLKFQYLSLTAELQRRTQAMEMRCWRKILHISYKDHVTDEEVRAKIQQTIGPHEDLLKIVKRRKLQGYGYVSRSSGLARTILQGTVKGGRRQGRQRKRWKDNIREWTGLEFGRSQRAVENREKWRKLVAKSSVVPQWPLQLRDWRWWWWWWWWLFQWNFSHGKFRLLFQGKAICDSHTTQPMVYAGCFSVSIIHQTLTWTTESLACAPMFMHVIVHRGARTHLRESALKVDSGRKIPCRTGELNLPQWCAGLTLCQLNYIPILFRGSHKLFTLKFANYSQTFQNFFFAKGKDQIWQIIYIFWFFLICNMWYIV